MNQNTASGVSFDSCLKAISNLYKYGFREVRVKFKINLTVSIDAAKQTPILQSLVVEGNPNSLAELQKHVERKMGSAKT